MDVAGRTLGRKAYFGTLWRDVNGYVCVGALRRMNKNDMKLSYFHLPEDMPKFLTWIEAHEDDVRTDLYFCPNILSEPDLHKTKVAHCPALWADLDTCSPEEVEPSPTLITETSPGRFQALWVFDERVGPQDGENRSRRIAYRYADLGCDRSGWDLVQLLRIPYTVNHKYHDTDDLSQQVIVQVVRSPSFIYRLNEFDHLPEVTQEAYEGRPMPAEPTQDGLALLEKYLNKLPQRAWDLYQVPPTRDWSGVLFALEMMCFEAGMTAEEVFSIASTAACNKFTRDGRGIEETWKDVSRAEHRYNHYKNVIMPKPRVITPLLTDEERSRVAGIRTFVEEYIDWASKLGDAATQYHEGGAFMILSALLSGAIVLPTSFGKLIPNLWFMILADTTLTRKSTAMDIAVDLLVEVDPDAVLATDGSIEGMMQGLSTRPKRPSMFLRDEFSGLLEQMVKKDYYAGTAETLTKLYDGKLQKRILKKETITVQDPVLLVFAGGIKKRVQALLTLEHISSGFIPRFLFLTAESDTERIRPLGPPTNLDTSGRDKLKQDMIDMYEYYGRPIEFTLPNGVRLNKPNTWEAALTEAAWLRYNEFEKTMLKDGVASEQPDIMTPLFDRLAKSTLKATLLLAAARKLTENIVIDVDDILLGIKYAEGWREYAYEVVQGVGRTMAEAKLDDIMDSVKRSPGVSRATLMQQHRLTAREADAVFSTLEQRGLVHRSLLGKAHVYHAA